MNWAKPTGDRCQVCSTEIYVGDKILEVLGADEWHNGHYHKGLVHLGCVVTREDD